MSGFTNTNTNTNNTASTASAALDSATLSFHNIVKNVNETPETEVIKVNEIVNTTKIEIEIQHFGMLKIKAATLTKVLTKMLRIVMLIDLSGSMDEKCKDRRTQIHHMRTVTKNLIRELHKFKDSETRIQFIVKGFESDIHHILDIPNLLDLSEEKITSEIIPEIDKLRSLGWTNLEAALKEGRHCVHKEGEEKEREKEKEEIKNMIVVITDGDANQGETRPAKLRKLLPSNSANFILGLGVGYDAKILQEISDGENKHINDPESAGNCVGEIIHKFLYEALTNVEVIVQNGLIYNYKNNTWSTYLAIPSIASEETRNFSIMSSTPDTVIIKIRCLINGSPFEHIISENEKTDLTMFQFRQAVQESLYKVKELEQLRREMRKSTYTGNLDYIIFGLKDEDDLYSSNEEIKERKAQEAKNRQEQFDKVQTEFKEEMKQLLIKMLRYMNDNDLNNDAFYKTLCMDLKVTMDNVGKQNAEMYINSRITSQGRQETYTCDTINDEEDGLNSRRRMRFGAPIKFTRQTACNNYDLDEEDPYCYNQNEEELAKALEEDAQNEVVSVANASVANALDDELLATFNKSIRQQATFASPYSSPQKLGLMRGVSSQQDDEQEEDKEDE